MVMLQRGDTLSVELRDICGDVGWPEAIVTCSKCKVARTHVYCMQIFVKIVPDDWMCETCLSGNDTISSNNNIFRDPGFDVSDAIEHVAVHSQYMGISVDRDQGNLIEESAPQVPLDQSKNIKLPTNAYKANDKTPYSTRASSLLISNAVGHQGRLNKEGKLEHECVQKVWNGCDVLSQSVSQDEIQDSGCQEMLARASNVQEHTGHVRGVGFKVSQRVCFPPQKHSKQQKKSELEELKGMLKTLEQ